MSIARLRKKDKDTFMELDKDKRYSCIALRVYEEDYNDIEIFQLINTLTDKGFSRILCCKHIKEGAKNHYHLLLISNTSFRPSFVYNMGILPHWCSDVENRKGMYFYIKEHKGKEEEDKENGHRIEVVHDTINYKTPSNGNSKNDLPSFFNFVEEILKSRPLISKHDLLFLLMEENPSYMGLYLKHYSFIDKYKETSVMQLATIEASHLGEYDKEDK